MDSDSNQRNGKPVKVLIGYHFFPHYREGILSRLSSSKDFDYIFVGDLKDSLSGVKEVDVSQPWLARRFRRARCFRIFECLWQPRLLERSISSGATSWILLCLPTNLSVWTTAVAGRLLGKNVVFWGHGWIKKYDTLRGMVRKLFFHLPNSILLYGHYAKELAIEDGIPAERLHVVYNSLDYEAQLVMRAKPGAGINIEERRKYFANPDLPILICSSRLTLQRELPLAFEAMALLKRDGLETNLLLLGDGPERQRLEALARELNLNVHFVGACYDEARIATLTQLANLTIAPGQVGLTAMHSLTYGVPVITHSDPANQMPESEAVIDGWNGVLFQRGDVNDLARAIRDGLCHFREIDKTRERCYEVIDRFYNPNHQAKIIERAVRRQPALDDGWEEFVSSRSVRAR